MRQEPMWSDWRPEFQQNANRASRRRLLVSMVAATALVGSLVYLLPLQAPAPPVKQGPPASPSGVSQATRQATAAAPTVRTPPPAPEQRTAMPGPARPVTLAKPEGDTCPPGQVAGVMESERTGRRVICHRPSYAMAPQPAETPRHESPRSNVRAPRVVVQQPAYQPVDDRKQACDALSRKIERLDALARQPQSGHTQDRIRADRQSARDEQFRLRCR